MRLFENRLEKLERQINDIFHPVKWVAVTQYEGESEEDAIRLAGLPAKEENRGVMFRKFVVSIDKATGKTTLTKRQESVDTKIG